MTNFFNTTGGIPMVFGTLTPGGLTQVSGEAATGSQQTTFDAMTQFMGLMTDPFTMAAAAMLRQRLRGGMRAVTPRPQRTGAARDAYAMFNKAPVTDLRSALERLGGGLRRFADHRRQCDGRDRIRRPRASMAPRSAPTIVFRRLRLPALRWPAAAPTSRSRVAAPDTPTCSRPAHLSGTPSGRLTFRLRWPMAGRTSPPIAP